MNTRQQGHNGRMLLLCMLLASPIRAESRQLVLSVSAGWEETRTVLRLYERPSAAAAWAAASTPFDGSLGPAGLAWGRGLHPQGLDGPQKREGDGKSPAGIFELRVVTGYGEAAPAGMRMPYRQATATLRCVDDARSVHYNRLADEATTRKDWSSAEDMRRPDELYRFTVWVGHNDAPVAPGVGSCIFLHLREGPQAVTAGCTAFEAEPMQKLLRWLDPQARPVLVQLPEDELGARAAAWRLPPARP